MAEAPEEPSAAGTITGFTFSRTIQGEKEFDVKAKRAVYYEQENHARFEDAAIIFYSKNGPTITLSAQEGTVRTDSNDISASGNVIIRSSAGYTLEAKTLSYKAEEKLIFTDEPIRLISDRMTLSGGRLKLRMDEQKLEIENSVKGTIER